MKIKAVSLLLGCALLLGACAGMSLFSGAGKEFDKGLVFFNNGKYGEAIPHFSRAVELDPEFGKAHLYLGRTHLNLGQWVQALQSLRIAYRLTPYETQKETLTFLMDALFGASLSEIKAGNFQEAIQYLQEGMDLEPQSDKLKSNLYSALISLAGKFLSEKNIPEAIESYQQAADLMPKNLNAYLGLARAFLQNGELLKAASYLNQAEKIDPDNVLVKTLLMQILKMQ